MQSRDLTGRTTVAGLFSDREQAERAIRDLQTNGFTGDQIGIAMRDRGEQDQLAEDTGTKAAEGAVSGAVGGGLLGGLVGFLVGVGALAIPGIGPVIAGGALATAFGLGGGTAVAGAGIGAAAGGIVGGLVGMGIPEHEARHFEEGFRSGGVLVTVNGGSRVMDALQILERNGADTGPGSVGANQRGTGQSGEGQSGPGAGTAAGAVGGGAAGAAAGAAIGTGVAGPLGTVPGAVIGGIGGATAGGAAGADAADEEGPNTRRTR